MAQVAPAPIEMERADPGEKLVGTDVPYGEMEVAVHRAPDTVIGLTMKMQGGNVVVDDVHHFHQSELKAGDVIRKVNGEPVSTAAEALAIFEGDKKSEFTGTASIYRDRPPTPPPEPELKPKLKSKPSGWGFLGQASKNSMPGDGRKSVKKSGAAGSKSTRWSDVDIASQRIITEPREMFDDMVANAKDRREKVGAKLAAVARELAQGKQELRIGTMCSGTEAPLMALDMINNALFREFGSSGTCQ